MLGLCLVIGCSYPNILTHKNAKDVRFQQLTKKALRSTSPLSRKELVTIEKLEKELLARDTKYLKLLAKQSASRKWADQFFVQNKIDQRYIALKRLEQKSKLPEEYEIVTSKTDQSMKSKIRLESAKVQYEKVNESLNSKNLDRYAQRKLFQSLDSVNIFETGYKSTDSLLTLLSEQGKTNVNFKCPEQLSAAITSKFTRLEYPWFSAQTNEAGTFPMSCSIAESKPKIVTYKDTLLECLIVNDASRDSIQAEMYYNPNATIQNIRKANSPNMAMTYAYWLVKQATFCYDIDWLLDGDKYLFTVCDEYENIHKTYKIHGNSDIVNRDNCAVLTQQTKNMNNELVISKAKQNAIRKLMDHLEEVAIGLDLEKSYK